MRGHTTSSHYLENMTRSGYTMQVDHDIRGAHAGKYNRVYIVELLASSLQYPSSYVQGVWID